MDEPSGSKPTPAVTKQSSKPLTLEENDELIENFLAGKIAFDNYDTLLEDEDESELPKEEVKAPRVTKKIPPHIRALIGDSHIRFAQGDHETAKMMCFEVIRQFSSISDPYITLAEIFETSDPDKSLDYYMVAALCSPKNCDLWERCAVLSVNRNKIKRAIFCYTNVLRCKPSDVNLHLKRIQLLRRENDTKNMLRSYVKMMQILPPSYFEFLIDVAERVAFEYHELKDSKKAIDALNIPFQKCPHLVTPRIVNIMLELLISVENYSYALDIFLEFCNIEIEILVDELNNIKVESYVMPEALQIDLRIKFIICTIKLKSFHLLDSLLNPLLILEDEEVDNIGDLFLDIIEALMDLNRHEDALKLLVPLIKSKNYSLAAVWLKYGDCQKACKMYEQAVDSYRVVMQLAPLHIEVKYQLAEVLTKLDRKCEALGLLHQDPQVTDIDINLLILKIKLLKELEEYDEYFESFYLLISRHCETLRHYEEIRAVLYLERPGEKLARLKKLRELRCETLEEKPTFIIRSEPTMDEEYSWLVETLQLCSKLKKFALMQRFAFTALTSRRFPRKFEELSLIAYFACIFNNDSYHAFPLIREILIHHRTNNLAWNLFNVLLQRSDDVRNTTLMMRFLSSYPENYRSKLLEANYCLSVGNNKICLGYYLTQLRTSSKPLICLLFGCVLLHIFGQKFTKNKKRVTKMAFAVFSKYFSTRSREAHQEVFYNLGRLYQHFGLGHLAYRYYNLALQYTGSVHKNPNLDLKQEASYNLHIIYKNSHNYAAARNLLIKYNQV